MLKAWMKANELPIIPTLEIRTPHILEVITGHVAMSGCELKELTYVKQGKEVEITLHLTEG